MQTPGPHRHPRRELCFLRAANALPSARGARCPLCGKSTLSGGRNGQQMNESWTCRQTRRWEAPKQAAPLQEIQRRRPHGDCAVAA